MGRRAKQVKEKVVKPKRAKLPHNYYQIASYHKFDKVVHEDLKLIPIKVWQVHKGDKVFDKQLNFIGTISKIKLPNNPRYFKLYFKEWFARKWNKAYPRQYYLLINKNEQ